MADLLLQSSIKDIETAFTSFAATGGGGKDYKFTMEELEPNKFNIIYPVNENLIGMLCSRPVLVQGGMFDIMPHNSNRAVYTTIMSPDPNTLATEIGKRLKNRIESDGDSLNACPMS